MGFFDTVRRVLHIDNHPARDVSRAWGLDEEGAVPEEDHPADTSKYDQAQWQKKMKRILGDLPGSKPSWAELMAEARALKLDPEWLKRCQREEFALLVRRAVSDRHFTEAEHRKLDVARELIGIPEAEAEATLHSVIAEAEKFFGKAVEGA
jgi:hypothetical protein